MKELAWEINGLIIFSITPLRMDAGRQNVELNSFAHSVTKFTHASLDRSLISFDLDSFSIEFYDLDLRGLSMTPISIQNALQNHYLGAEDRSISKAKGSRDETSGQNTDLSLHPSEDQTTAQSIDLAIKHSEDRTTVQDTNSSLHPSEDQTTAQSIDLAIQQHPEDRTTVQYADSKIYSPADRTILQSPAPISDRLEEQTICQKDPPHIQQAELPPVEFNKSVQGQTVQHYIVQEKKSFFSRFIHLKEPFLYAIQKITNFKPRRSNPTRQLASADSLKTQPFPSQSNRPTRDGMQTEVQPSLDQYQKVLQELDHCWLSFAKELARNGKIRDAIAQAKKISETSRFFKDAQTLIRSWKQL
jgi:hypothetical protein